jgi:hypothetical protein
MKRKLIYTFLIAGMVGTGCVKHFDDLNTDPNSPSLENPAVAAGAANALFSSAISRGLMLSNEFQRVQALYADLYGQYFATSATYFNSDRYQVNQAWLDAGWNLFYPRDIKNLVDIIKSPNANNNQKQIARIWKVFLFHRMVDFYGDIPYFDAGDPTKPEKFDSQREIYADFFKELTEAVNAIDAGGSYDAKDVIYAGNTAKWKAFGNTLRLRLALRISNVDPAKAKSEAEAAIAAGVFSGNADNALAKVSNQLPNALNQITGFNEFRMSATMESIMNGYKDPRIGEFFSPVGSTGDAAYVGKYNGIRNGTSTTDLGLAENQNKNNSNVGLRFLPDNQFTNPRIVLTYAEACFLLAEAKLKGYAGPGDAKTWYENGIRASMNQFGITNSALISAYLSSETDLPTIPAQTTAPVSPLPVAFSEVEAEQMEQIQIQKWLAVYPDGFEAWANFRRTGLPRFYAPANYDPTSDVIPGSFIQRLPYTDNMKSRNTSGVAAAETRMGGNGQAVKLWFAGGN